MKTANIGQFAKVEITNYEELNDELMRCKIRVMHTGENANGFNIDKSVINNAMDSIYYIPIVGEIVEYENGTSFGDHAIEEDVNGDMICHTVPFGVVAGKNDNTIEWETIDGKEYFSVHGYLWRRYDLVDKFENQDEFYQSMEICINKSKKKRGRNIIDVTDFSFSALCILNKDVENWENSVEPCFEKANIQKFSKNNGFMEAFAELKNKVETFSTKECGNMEDEKKIEDFIKEDEKEVEVSDDENKEVVESIDDKSSDDTDEGDKEDFSKDEPEEVEVNTKETFALTLDETIKQIRQALSERKIEVEYWGEKYQENEFYFNTLFEVEGLGAVVVVYDNAFGNQYFIPYRLNGDVVILDFDKAVKCVATYRVFEEGEAVNPVEIFAEKMEVVKSAFSRRENILQTEISGLKEYREACEKAERQERVNNIIAKFNFKDAEIAEVKEEAMNGSIDAETLELHLFALAGKKALANKGVDEVTDKDKELVKFSKNTRPLNPYGDLIK